MERAFRYAISHCPRVELKLQYGQDIPNMKVLYFGDHFIGDVRSPSLRPGWDSVAVVEELEDHEDVEGTAARNSQCLPNFHRRNECKPPTHK